MNWQNVPRDDKTIKRAVLPKRGALVFADYEQIEPKLTGYFAAKIGFPELAAQLREGVDSYTAVAKLVTGQGSVNDLERQTWKKTFLALVYGGGVPAIQRYFPGLSYPEAKQMITTFHSAWPAVRALQNEVQAVNADRGYIQTPWGRQLHAEEYGEHKMLNKLIQGSAADLMKHAILRVDERLGHHTFMARMVSVVHDELILDAPLHEVGDLAELLPLWMGDPADEVGITEIVPITAGVEVTTTSWADKTDYTDWKETLESDRTQAVHLQRDAG